MTEKIINYTIKEPIELNHAYISFIAAGGLFIPTKESFTLGEKIQLHLTLPRRDHVMIIDGKIVWMTPANAIQHELPGIGLQLIGDNAKAIHAEIQSCLVSSKEIGGYTSGAVDALRSV